MDLEKAKEISQKCSAHVWFQMGLKEERPPSLYEYSLEDLLNAQRVISEYNKTRTDGCASLLCADRLIAALFVAYHYAVEDPDRGEVTPIIFGNGNAVVVVKEEV